MTKLLGYDFLIRYKKEKYNTVADALSIRLKEEETTLTLAIILVLEFDMLDELNLSYLIDSKLYALLRRTKNNELSSKYILRNGLLYYKHKLYVSNNNKLKIKLLELLHNNSIRGHLGYDKALHRVRNEFFWPNLKLM